jgi:hypothetical protein
MAGPRARKKGNTPYICILPGVQSIGSLATTDGVRKCGVASGLPAALGWAIIPAARAVLVVAAAQK